jgi:peptide/nickel transport system substrate-binding protein
MGSATGPGVATRHRARKVVAALGLVAALGGSLAACGGKKGNDSSDSNKGSTESTTKSGKSTSIDNDGKTPKRGGTLRYALGAETPAGYCLPEAQLASGIPVVSAIYDRLTILDSDGNPSPDLAESFTHNDAYDQWTFKVRPGVTFHDGTKLDAQVVADNINAYRGTYPTRKPQLFIFTFANIKDVKVVDDMTVQVDTKIPWVALPNYFASPRVGIMAKAQLDDTKTCDRKLIGTGPFSFVSWKVNDKMVVKANPDYWQKAPDGKPYPYLDEIDFVPIPDETSRIQAVQTGDVDLIPTGLGSGLSAVRKLQDEGKVSVNEIPSANVGYLMFNAAREPFDDITARRAVVYGADLKQINDIANDNLFTIAKGPFNKGTMGYLADTGFPDQDVAKAKQYVADYKTKHGTALSFEMHSTPDPQIIAIAQLLQQQMKAIGVNVRITQGDQATLINDALAGKFQSTLWTNSHATGDPDGQYVWWYSSSPVNFGKIKDPSMDKLLDEGRSEPDEAKRTTIYEDLNRKFASGLWNLWFTFGIDTVVTTPNVHGLQVPKNPDGGEPYYFEQLGNPMLSTWKE